MRIPGISEPLPAAVVAVPHAWYAMGRSRDLRSRPVARRLYGAPLVLFRDASGKPGALLDRCAHRNVPLSAGRVRGGTLQCPYHGWQYDGAGECVRVPGLLAESRSTARRVPCFAVREQQGLVWLWGAPGELPGSEPPRFPHLDQPNYGSVRFARTVDASLVATLENMLDVPHTAFLHRGLFRTEARREIEARLARWADRIEVEYVGEPRPTGLVARLLAPASEAVVTHFDRFRLPSVAEVEYRIGDESHLSVTAMLTPLTDDRTRFEAVVSFRLPAPHGLVRLIVAPVARKIFAQDADILRRQSAAIRELGGESCTSTEMDLVGPQVVRLLRDVAPGPVPPAGDAPRWQRTVRFRV